MPEWIAVDVNAAAWPWVEDANGKGQDAVWPDIGNPKPRMLKYISHWLAKGFDVRLVAPEYVNVVPNIRAIIDAWSLKHFGRVLPVTATIDSDMISFWSEKVVRVNDIGYPDSAYPIRLDDNPHPPADEPPVVSFEEWKQR